MNFLRNALGHKQGTSLNAKINDMTRAVSDRCTTNQVDSWSDACDLFETFRQDKKTSILDHLEYRGIDFFSKFETRLNENNRRLGRAVIFIADVSSFKESQQPICKTVTADGQTYNLPDKGNTDQFLAFLRSVPSMVNLAKSLLDKFGNDFSSKKWGKDLNVSLRRVEEGEAKVIALGEKVAELRSDFDEHKSDYVYQLKSLHSGLAANRESLEQLTRVINEQKNRLASIERQILQIVGDLSKTNENIEGMDSRILEARNLAIRALATSWLAIEVMTLQDACTKRIFEASDKLRVVSDSLKVAIGNVRQTLSGANLEANRIINAIDSGLMVVQAATPPPFGVIVGFARRWRSLVVTTTASGESEERLAEISTRIGSGFDSVVASGQSMIGGAIDGLQGPLSQGVAAVGESVKNRAVALFREKIPDSVLKIGWGDIQFDEEEVLTAFAEGRDQMVRHCNDIIKQAMEILIDRDALVKAIDEGLKSGGTVTPAKVAEDAVKKVCGPISEALNEWAPVDAMVRSYQPPVDDNLALMFELIMYGENFAENYRKNTSVVNVPMAFVDRFRTLRIVVSQTSTEEERANAELVEASEDETTDGGVPERTDLIDMKGVSSKLKRLVRFINGVSNAAGTTARVVKEVAGLSLQAIAMRLAAATEAVLKWEERSSSFYQQGLVPWRDIEGWNYSHAAVLRLSVMMFSNRNVPEGGLRASILASSGEWKKVQSGESPLDFLKDDIKLSGFAVDSHKKRTIVGGRKLTVGAEQALFRDVVDELLARKA